MIYFLQTHQIQEIIFMVSRYSFYKAVILFSSEAEFSPRMKIGISLASVFCRKIVCVIVFVLNIYDSS